MDSPARSHPPGRAGRAAAALLPESTVGHLDACLGCMACVTACPSGVKYDQHHRDRPGRGRDACTRGRARERLLREAIFALFPYPKRLRAMRGPLAAYQRSGLQRLVRRSGAARAAAADAADDGGGGAADPAPRAPLPERIPAQGERRAVVGMLTGCVQREFFPDVNAATARVLAAEGCDVVVPAEPGLLRRAERAQRPQGGGAGLRPPAAGQLRRRRRRARGGQLGRLRLVDEGVRPSCSPTTRSTPSGPRSSPAKVRDVTELLVELGPVATRHPLPVSVAYHDACHLAHAQGVRTPAARAAAAAYRGSSCARSPRAACAAAAPASTTCCSPEPARELGDRKAGHVAATGADLLVTANPGCLLQIASALGRARHVDRHRAHRRGARRLDRRTLPMAPDRPLTDRPPPWSAPCCSATFQPDIESVGGSLTASALVAALPLADPVRDAGRRCGSPPGSPAWCAGGRARGGDRGVRDAGRPGAAGRHLGGGVRLLPDHVDRHQRDLGLQHDRRDRALRRAAAVLRRASATTCGCRRSSSRSASAR